MVIFSSGILTYPTADLRPSLPRKAGFRLLLRRGISIIEADHNESARIRDDLLRGRGPRGVAGHIVHLPMVPLGDPGGESLALPGERRARGDPAKIEACGPGFRLHREGQAAQIVVIPIHPASEYTREG
jgi:hypothetical protein